LHFGCLGSISFIKHCRINGRDNLFSSTRTNSSVLLLQSSFLFPPEASQNAMPFLTRTSKHAKLNPSSLIRRVIPLEQWSIIVSPTTSVAIRRGRSFIILLLLPVPVHEELRKNAKIQEKGA
jgi:hypothetical protein